jgi:hypothetical protein
MHVGIRSRTGLSQSIGRVCFRPIADINGSPHHRSVKGCFLIFLFAAGIGALNWWGHRIGEAPGAGYWVPKDRSPRTYKFVMAIDWLIFAMAVFGGFACLYSSSR